MGIHNFLNDPEGGQLFSAYVVLFALLGFWAFLIFSMIGALRAGEEIHATFGDVAMVVISIAIIVRVTKYLRSRHGAR